MTHVTHLTPHQERGGDGWAHWASFPIRWAKPQLERTEPEQAQREAMRTGETEGKRRREVDALVVRIMFSMQDMVVEQKRVGVERVGLQCGRRAANHELRRGSCYSGGKLGDERFFERRRHQHSAYH